MAFEDVYLVSDKLVLTTQLELDELEAWLGAPLPCGYATFMTSLGNGSYCDFMNVLAPEQIREVCEERREFVREYYLQFWEGNEDILPFDEAVKGVRFAATDDGDEVFYCPGDAPQLIVLPRHDDVVYWLESGFEDPLHWSSVKDHEYVELPLPPFRYFTPDTNRAFIEFFTAGAFDMHQLADSFRARWSGSEMPAISDSHCMLLFPKAIGGRMQLTQAPNDHRIGIRIDYDGDCLSEVEAAATALLEMGFYETGRHPKSEK
jgi:hypothetical protein